MRIIHDLLSLIAALWKLEEWEFQYIATQSWWDTMDTVASHLTGAVIYQYPKTRTVMDQ